MDEAKILELARAAGIDDCGGFAVELPSDSLTTDSLVAFARLVAAAERERLYQGALERGLVALENRGRLIDGIMEGK